MRPDQYHYRSIRTALKSFNQHSIGKNQLHLYGIVVEYSTPSLSKKNDYYITLRLVDPSCYSDGSSNERDEGARNGMTAQCFASSLVGTPSLARGVEAKLFADTVQQLPRIRAVGDIIRLHRMNLSSVREEDGPGAYIWGKLLNPRLACFCVFDGEEHGLSTPYDKSSATYNWDVGTDVPILRRCREMVRHVTKQYVDGKLLRWASGRSYLRRLDQLPLPQSFAANGHGGGDVTGGMAGASSQPFDVFCKVLHATCLGPFWVLLLWDGSDAPLVQHDSRGRLTRGRHAQPSGQEELLEPQQPQLQQELQQQQQQQQHHHHHQHQQQQQNERQAQPKPQGQQQAQLDGGASSSHQPGTSTTLPFRQQGIKRARDASARCGASHDDQHEEDHFHQLAPAAALASASAQAQAAPPVAPAAAAAAAVPPTAAAADSRLEHALLPIEDAPLFQSFPSTGSIIPLLIDSSCDLAAPSGQRPQSGPPRPFLGLQPGHWAYLRNVSCALWCGTELVLAAVSPREQGNGIGPAPSPTSMPRGGHAGGSMSSGGGGIGNTPQSGGHAGGSMSSGGAGIGNTPQSGGHAGGSTHYRGPAADIGAGGSSGGDDTDGAQRLRPLQGVAQVFQAGADSLREEREGAVMGGGASVTFARGRPVLPSACYATCAAWLLSQASLPFCKTRVEHPGIPFSTIRAILQHPSVVDFLPQDIAQFCVKAASSSSAVDVGGVTSADTVTTDAIPLVAAGAQPTAEAFVFCHKFLLRDATGYLDVMLQGNYAAQFWGAGLNPSDLHHNQHQRLLLQKKLQELMEPCASCVAINAVGACPYTWVDVCILSYLPEPVRSPGRPVRRCYQVFDTMMLTQPHPPSCA